MDHSKIMHAFNKFAGKEIDVTITQHTHKDFGTIEKYDLGRAQKTLEELQDVAQQMGMKLRIWLPNTIGISDYRTDRLNVHIKKEPDGKWRIQKHIAVG